MSSTTYRFLLEAKVPGIIVGLHSEGLCLNPEDGSGDWEGGGEGGEGGVLVQKETRVSASVDRMEYVQVSG